MHIGKPITISLEVYMNKTLQNLPFWQKLLLLTGLIVVIALLGGLITGSVGMISNIFFLAAFVLWIIAVIPAFGEVGSNTRLTIQARKEGINPKKLIDDKEEHYRARGRITFLFGLCGFICFLLAFVTLIL
jgi:hypothetical protein